MHVLLCANRKVDLADCFQCFSLLFSVSGASQQLDLVLTVDYPLSLVWNLTLIQTTQTPCYTELVCEVTERKKDSFNTEYKMNILLWLCDIHTYTLTS